MTVPSDRKEASLLDLFMAGKWRRVLDDAQTQLEGETALAAAVMAENERLLAVVERYENERNEAVGLLRAVAKAADDDARMGYPLPGESCVYVVLALGVDQFLAALAGTEESGDGRA